MNVVAFRQEGYQLLHQGSIELAHIEANGIRVDLELLHRTRKDIETKVREKRAELEKTDVWKTWKRRYGSKANILSNKQIGAIFYGQLGYEAKKQTEKGEDSTDYESLSAIDHPFIAPYLGLRRLLKSDEFLSGILFETIGDRLHPVFNLHIARSYRSSSDSPNFQNNPVRDKIMAQMIRSVFIPSPKSVIVENDFKGIEVGVSACYHKDKRFIDYITTPGKDMHRDMAAQIYKMKPEEVSKDVRHASKNRFVFPQFYGNYYVACARDLWEAAVKGNFKSPDGKASLIEYLRTKGIKKLGACDPDQSPLKGTFEKHIQEVEHDFWGNRFREYEQWRRNSFRSYLERGYFDILSGFRVYGDFNRKIVTNYPIQGAAFHCLLWSLIQLNKSLRKYKFKSKVVGQIHDSAIGDVHVEELSNYLELFEEIVSVRLRAHYKWLIVPLEIEYEITPSEEAGGTWFDKREVKFKKGVFQHPSNPEKKTRDAAKFINALDRLHEKEKA